MKRINLIPEEARKPALSKRLKDCFFKSPLLRLFAAGAVFFVFIIFWQTGSILRYRILIARAKINMKTMQAELAHAGAAYAKAKKERQAIEQEAGVIAEKLNILKAIRQENIAWANLLSRLSKLLPDNLWVNKVVLNKESITIIGSTFDNSTVSSFMSGLDDSGYFKDTGFTYTKKAETGDRPVIDFEVTTHLVLEKAAQ